MWVRVATLLLLVTACQAAPYPESRLELTPCTLDGVTAQCGTLPVPEDRAAATGHSGARGYPCT